MSEFGTRFLMIKILIDVSVFGHNVIYPGRWPILFNLNFSTKWCNNSFVITALFFTLFQVSWQNYSLEQVKVKIAGPGNLHKTASTLKLRSLSVTVGLKYKNEFFRVSSWAAVAYSGKRKHNSRKCSFH